MSQKFCLFYAGYTASAPSLYYNKLVLNERLLEDGPSEQVKHLSEELHDLSYETETSLQTAISIADHFKMQVMPKPVLAEDYFNWQKHYVHVFESQFPLTRIDHYYFFYSQKIAEVLSHIGLVITLTDLAQYLDLQPYALSQINKHLRETEWLMFKTMAAAALLSSEPRHGYFRTFYNELNNGFETFKSVNALDLDNNGLKDLKIEMETFKYEVINGFKKCIALLKELEI